MHLRAALVHLNCLVHLFLHLHCTSKHDMLEASGKEANSGSVINSFPPPISPDPEGLVLEIVSNETKSVKLYIKCAVMVTTE